MGRFPSLSLTPQSCSSTPSSPYQGKYRREVQDIMHSEQQVPMTFSPCCTVFFAFFKTPAADSQQKNRRRNRKCEWRLPWMAFIFLRHKEGNQRHFAQVLHQGPLLKRLMFFQDSRLTTNSYPYTSSTPRAQSHHVPA